MSKPLDRLFKRFDREQLAAASLAQVHKAVLPSGEKVAIGISYCIQYSLLNLHLSVGTFGLGLLVILLVWIWRK